MTSASIYMAGLTVVGVCVALVVSLGCVALAGRAVCRMVGCQQVAGP